MSGIRKSHTLFAVVRETFISAPGVGSVILEDFPLQEVIQSR